ncbi:hypothetical protein QQF64_035876 [Cirrhinus molitorella]|uniref:SGNH hydrolase-type esterase domain-containing protein n=1 Tax=Cirrhinus molitorella TaxID=172907 RepID=A0ABR3NGZ4_9TELE
MAFIKEESEEVKIEEAFRVEHKNIDEQKEKVVWIVGHNCIKWAERRAEAAWEPNLGLQKTSVHWLWKEDMRWSQLLDVVLATGVRPDVLVIHAGGNDLGLMRSVDLLSSMKKDLSVLQKCTDATVIFSGITERHVWRCGEGPKINKARKFVNSVMAKHMTNMGGEFIDNKEITIKRRELFGWDGVCLSDEGNDIFLRNLASAISK